MVSYPEPAVDTTKVPFVVGDHAYQMECWPLYPGLSSPDSCVAPTVDPVTVTSVKMVMRLTFAHTQANERQAALTRQRWHGPANRNSNSG